MKTIVISDLHLGLDDRISEDVSNRPKLVDFIDKIRTEKDLREQRHVGRR